VLAMHERILGTVFARAKRQHQEAFAGSAQAIKEKLKLLDRIGVRTRFGKNRTLRN